MTERVRDLHGAGVAGLAVVSTLVVSLQIDLMRSLSVATYSHFSYLVISIALLGFGASGTILSIIRERIIDRFDSVSFAALVLFVVSTAWGHRIALLIPLDVQFLFQSGRQIAYVALFVLITLVPFLAGGFFIGSAIMMFSQRVGRVYGVNLFASGLGGIVGIGLASVLPVEQLTGWCGLIGALALPLWLIAGPVRPAAPTGRRVVAASAAGVVALVSVLVAPQLRLDPHKAEAHVLRLLDQQDAVLVAEDDGSRARLAAYDAPSIHFTMFASPLAPLPPQQISLYSDGSLVGSVLEIDSPDQAPILSALPQSLSYRLVDKPAVLLLGETSGFNVWLALAHGARSVTVVQQNPALVRLVRSDLSDRGGSVLSRPEVTIVTMTPRLYLERSDSTYDIIQLVAAEGMPASSAGLGSLREDYLLTIEGLTAALNRMTPNGVLSVTRGLQSPARDNLRMFALIAAAVEEDGGEPSRRMAQARNYLSSTTLAAKSPMGPDVIDRLLSACEQLLMDADFYPGIQPGAVTRLNRLPGESGSVYNRSAVEISQGLTDFSESWAFDISPPSDDRPYFHSFLRPGRLRTSGLDSWWVLASELGSLVVALTLAIVSVVGIVLIVIPVVLAPRSGRAVTWWSVLYFMAIGVGFMLLEILFIQRLTLYLGDPLIAATAAVTSVLVGAGTGSELQSRLRISPLGRICAGGAAVVVLSTAFVFGAPSLLGLIARSAGGVRFVLALLVIAPVAFFMGWLFPAGISALKDRHEVPVAWAANGVASVVAAPLAVLLAMWTGFRVVSFIATGCYATVVGMALLRSGLERAQITRE